MAGDSPGSHSETDLDWEGSPICSRKNDDTAQSSFLLALNLTCLGPMRTVARSDRVEDVDEDEVEDDLVKVDLADDDDILLKPCEWW